MIILSADLFSRHDEQGGSLPVLFRCMYEGDVYSSIGAEGAAGPGGDPDIGRSLGLCPRTPGFKTPTGKHRGDCGKSSRRGCRTNIGSGIIHGGRSKPVKWNGEGGIRTRETGLYPSAGLANRCIQPLCHLSKSFIRNNFYSVAQQPNPLTTTLTTPATPGNPFWSSTLGR